MKKRKDGLYAAQIYLGSVPILDSEGNPTLDKNGKPKQKRNYKTVYGKTQKEVKAEIAELKLKLGKGIDISAADDSFKTWADNFLANKKSEGVGASHLEGLNNFCAHLKPLYSQPLSKITVADIQNIINHLSIWHDGKPPLSKRTLTGVKQTASQIFKVAIVSRMTEFNPAEYVKIPKTATVTERGAIPEYQQKWIRETPHRAQRAAMIMLYAGLRRGEVAALTWGDIDFKKGTINVNKAVEYLPSGKVAIKPPKTAAGIRTVQIPNVLIDFLLLERNKDDCLYIVHTAKSKIMTVQAWRRLWASYMSDLNVLYGYDGKASKCSPGGLKMEIEPFTTHQLRHTFASLLYFSGVDALTARDQLGHTDIKTTLGIYTHLDKTHKEKSMNKLDEYLCQYDASNE